jgi:membrane protease subunit (stomatin/prohibitin family)
VDNIRISQVASKARELSKYMSTELDEDWKNLRGFEVVSVGIASVSYTDESRELINMRNQGAMLGDAAVREGYVQGAIARGMENAGKSGGGAQAFMGMGIGMNAAGNFMASASATNAAQMQAQEQARKEAQAAAKDVWKCSCGAENTGKFCTECGSARPVPAQGWTCACGKVNTGKFCSECGAKKPESQGWFCPECGHKNPEGTKFCPECGTKYNG